MKTILITGSTDGIGKLVATKFATEGHQVYIHGRNSEKLAKVISEIKQISNSKNVDGFVADFSDLQAVRSMAAEIRTKLSTLDVLINNAGIFKSPVDRVHAGDIRFVVNYLAPYLLTQEILPILDATKNSRIINLSSAAQSEVSISALEGNAHLSVNESYAQSKLALTMWSFCLAKEHKDITVIAVNPGSLLNTRMANEAYGQHWSPAEKGGDILYDLALSEAYSNDSGKYFDNDKGQVKGNFGPAHPDAYNEIKIKELINKTNEILS